MVVTHKRTGETLLTWPNETLVGADLSGARLEGAVLVNEPMTGACLQEAFLVGANFRLFPYAGLRSVL